MTDKAKQPQVWKPQRGPQMAFHECNAFEMLFGGAAGGSKDIDVSTPCLTDSGWKEAKDVTPLDKLVSIDGSYTKILGIYPQGLRQTYEVTFDDGITSCVGEGHLWKVWSTKHGYRDGWIIKDTKSLFHAKGNYGIPLLTSPAPGTYQSQTDPYILGLLIGDGTMKSARPIVYTPEPYIVDYLKQAGWNAYEYAYRKTVVQCSPPERLAKILRKELPCVKSENKYIPQELLDGTSEVRLALLQGLMDTDGTCGKDGSCSFSTTSKQLAEDVVYLVRSLGGKSSIEVKKRLGGGSPEKIKGNFHELDVRVSHCGRFPPFRLPRKAARVRSKVREDKRYIRTIEPSGLRQTVCFKVAHPSSLFIINGFVLTHNTESLLVESIRHTDNAKYNAILFRRSFPELQSSLVPRAYDIFSGMATARNQGLKWTFKSGATVSFAHLWRDEDKEKHKSSEYDYIGFDELTSFPETSYNYLFSRCRGKDPTIERRVRAGSNPTGIGWSWVKDRFVTPDPELVDPIEDVPYEFACGWKYRGRTYLDFDALPEGFDGSGEPVFTSETYTMYREKKSGLTRAFIPALLWGNEYIIKNDPDYILRLKSLDEYQKRALLTGSWDFPEGQFFDFQAHRHITEKPFDIPTHYNRYVAIDYGYTAPFCALWFAVSPLGKIYAYRELYARKLTTQEQAQYILQMSEGENINWFTCDPSMMARQGTGESHADVYGRHGVYLSASSNKRVPGWALIHEYLSNGKFEIFPSCPNLIREFQSSVRSRTNPEDLDCFVAGTKVETIEGTKNIEDIKLGDLILTPIGFQPCIKDGISGISHQVITVHLSNGEVLKGTKNHRVFVQGKGLTELQYLKKDDILSDKNILLCPKRASLIKILSILAEKAEDITNQMEHTSAEGPHLSIVRYGWIFMEKFLRVFISIIRIMITIIMTFPILSLLKLKNTPDITTIKDRGPCRRSSGNGEKALKGNAPSERMPKRCSSDLHRECLRARIVGKLLKRNIKHRDAVSFVEKNSEERKRLNAKSVQRNFTRGCREKKQGKPVRIIAVGNLEESATVYNLTVDRARLYYANGVLVTNTTISDHCFHPDTFIYTTQGKKKIKDLVGKTGFLYSRGGQICRFSHVRPTRKNCDVVSLTFDDGQTLTVTPDHLLLLPSGKWAPASSFRLNDLVQSASYPELQNESPTKTVKRITRGRAQVTFNLDVEETECLLADGVIAHNSLDAARYFFLTLKGIVSHNPQEESNNRPPWWNALKEKKKKRKMLLDQLF